MVKTVKDLCDSVDTTALLSLPLSNWRKILASECSVFVYGETYLAKRFDGINYQFCDKDKAEEILIDNLYALLRFKYFPKTSEEIDDRIRDIVKSFTANLKTTLKKVTFDDNNTRAISVKYIPDYCVAFQNGVYNFKDNCWLFKYDIVEIESLSNVIYLYDDKYIITWYLDYEFEPLPINILSMNLEEFIEFMKMMSEDEFLRSRCFELVYNMCHDKDHTFSLDKFKHFSQILGYSMLQSFSQYFVFLIGAGQNGKNSLFDGCFTNKLVPRPTSNSLDAIENDRFITGALENHSHNIFLETTPKVYKSSTMIKSLTGSMYQTIESKGVSKYSGIINCKFIFSGNDQDMIKFSDMTHGFKRRINMFEIFYTWDQYKKFLSQGDYYDTTFSDSLIELTSNNINVTTFVYIAMYGLLMGTDNFTRSFKFSYNDWTLKYSDIDFDLKEKLDSITIGSLLNKVKANKEYLETSIYDINKKLLRSSTTLIQIGLKPSPESVINLLSDVEYAIRYFSEYDIYLSTNLLKSLCGYIGSTVEFNRVLKNTFNLSTFEVGRGNKNIIRCRYVNGFLKIINS